MALTPVHLELPWPRFPAPPEVDRDAVACMRHGDGWACVHLLLKLCPVADPTGLRNANCLRSPDLCRGG